MAWYLDGGLVVDGAVVAGCGVILLGGGEEAPLVGDTVGEVAWRTEE